MDIMKHLRMTGSLGIIRRYIVTNGFDGAISMLGILAGSFFFGFQDPKVVTVSGISVAVALAISGFSSAYLSEAAEKKAQLKKLEKAMLKKLDHTEQEKASNLAPLLIAGVNGFAPFMFSMMIITPFFFPVAINTMYYSAFVISLLILFMLGLFMGNTAKQNIWYFGIKTLLLGVLTAFILYLVNFLL